MHEYWYEDGRYILVFPYADEETRVRIKRCEGRRWDRMARQWSLPPSPKSLSLLAALGFEVKQLYSQQTAAQALRYERPILKALRSYEPLGRFTLWPYQADAVEWLPDKALLYDQQALGKTLQAIAWAQQDSHVIVVSKLVLQPQWANTLADAAVSEAPGIVTQKATRWPVKEGWTLCNWERVGKLKLPDTPITLILDEATAIKNSRTKRTQAILKLGSKANRIICLTGTPIINRPMELWSMLMLLGQRYKYEFFPWVKRYCGAYQTPWGWDMTGATFLDELREDLLHFGLRRTKEEVKLALPPKVRETIVVQLKEKQLSTIRVCEAEVLGHAARGSGLTTGDGLASLQRLRVESAVAKAEFAAEWLNTRDSKTVVFCAFKEPLRLTQRAYDEINKSKASPWFVLATGDETIKQRLEAIKRFKEDPSVKVLGMTYDAGGMGLDIPEADTVVLLDRPWTPSEVEQAEDRIHRPGSKADRILIVSLSTGTPVEQHVLNTGEYKGNIIDAINGMAANIHIVLPTRGLL